ncbi:hemin uptake protein HemP [Rhodobacteraceae bacterium 2CG4]|uniref:Hemin uptake protein HemP n=1 Tax=Halovulum marinum TaxID=2662447 RepID=A0A6L5YWD0_9RHOB|nr:hemin uptake protein HemP [Halovulum marinum]MSU88517.1 hemin uptake protein HemP [Halovulum marinum]
MTPKPDARHADPDRAPRRPQMPVYDARKLTRDGVQAQLKLDGQLYFLRITRAGKLILTK